MILKRIRKRLVGKTPAELAREQTVKAGRSISEGFTEGLTTERKSNMNLADEFTSKFKDGMTTSEQVDVLTGFILKEFKHEPGKSGKSEGAIQVAIRLLAGFKERELMPVMPWERNEELLRLKKLEEQITDLTQLTLEEVKTGFVMGDIKVNEQEYVIKATGRSEIYLTAFNIDGSGSPETFWDIKDKAIKFIKLENATNVANIMNEEVIKV